MRAVKLGNVFFLTAYPEKRAPRNIQQYLCSRKAFLGEKQQRQQLFH